LEWHPEKVLFGSDAYSDANTPLSDYEEKQWLVTDKARRALAIALTGMLGDGEITRERAKEIAHMVMRDSLDRRIRKAPAIFGSTRTILDPAANRTAYLPRTKPFGKSEHIPRCR
jgi:hypothetical protein